MPTVMLADRNLPSYCSNCSHVSVSGLFAASSRVDTAISSLIRSRPTSKVGSCGTASTTACRFSVVPNEQRRRSRSPSNARKSAMETNDAKSDDSAWADSSNSASASDPSALCVIHFAASAMEAALAGNGTSPKPSSSPIAVDSMLDAAAAVQVISTTPPSVWLTSRTICTT